MRGLNQKYKSEISDEVFNIISQELGVGGNVCDILDKYFDHVRNSEKQFEDEYDSQSEDCREINQREKENYINSKLNKLKIRYRLSKLNLNITQIDFVATSPYSSAMWYEKSVYLKIETDYAFKPQIKDIFVKDYKNKIFNQDGHYSVILKILQST